MQVDQGILNEALNLVSRVVPSRPSHPVLANVLLQCDAATQTLTLTGFDLSLGVQIAVSCSSMVSWSVAIPSKLAVDIIGRLPGGMIVLDCSDEFEVSIQSLCGQFKIRGMDAEHYPDLPTLKETPIEFPVSVLQSGLDAALFAASGDETKAVLTGVHITASGNSIEFAATDGHRLSVFKAESEDDGVNFGEFALTVPSKSLREIQRLIAGSKAQTVSLAFDGGQLVATLPNGIVTSRLLDGNYPNYPQLLPKVFSRSLTVARKPLMQSLERIGVLADMRNGIVALEMSQDDGLTVSVDAADVGSGCESVQCEYKGDELKTAFNVKYLLEGLKAMGADEVQIQFNSSTSPAVVSPVGTEKWDYLVMPVQIRG